MARVAKERRIKRKARLARKREIAGLLELVTPFHAALTRGMSGDRKLHWLLHWARVCHGVYQ